MHGNNMSGLTSEIVRDCKKIIFINEVAKNTCQGLVPEDKGIIIPNPVDATKFKAKPVRTKKIQNLLNRDFKTIVVPSRVDDGKEIPMFQLVRILPDLAERIGGLNVIFLGDGNKLPELAETAYKLQTKKLNLNFIGQAEDVYNYINVADLVLACDRCAIEALLCKKIVFYMGQSKWKQLIQNENYYQALFTDQGYADYSDSDLLSHLTWMLAQAETVKLHTDKVYENVKELCDSEKVKEKIYELYKKKL
jgi:glycosyltransferase involved in cell wall biosynthesis